MNTKPMYVALVLSVVTLGVLAWQTTVTVRNSNLIEVYLDDRCVAARDRCVAACREELEEAVGPTRIDETTCKLNHGRETRDCIVAYPDQVQREQCMAEAQARFDQCMAPIKEIRREAVVEFVKCKTRCERSLSECRKDARDAFQSGGIGGVIKPEIPDKDELSPQPEPPGGPPK